MAADVPTTMPIKDFLFPLQAFMCESTGKYADRFGCGNVILLLYFQFSSVTIISVSVSANKIISSQT